MSNRTVQMRALVNGHITEGPISAKPRDPRNIFWTTPALAQHYIDNKVATPVVTSTLSEAPSIGPTETKPAEPTAKKKKKKVFTRQPAWPLDRFSKVGYVWGGLTAVCCASGCSFNEQQARIIAAWKERAYPRTASRPVLACNDAYLLAPFADVLYFADTKWWEWHRDKPSFKSFKGEKCTIFTTGQMVSDGGIAMLRNAGREGISEQADHLFTGGNSGHQQLNIAVLAGAKRIVLVGYDAKPGPGNRPHFFGEHPDRTVAPYAHMIESLKRVAPVLYVRGIEVLNASPDSAIECFRKVDLATVLGD